MATELYEWTGELAGALFTDFRHLEIVFRNRVDRALTRYARSLDQNVESWLCDSCTRTLGYATCVADRASGAGAGAVGQMHQVVLGEA